MKKKISMMLLSSRRRPDSEPGGRRRSGTPTDVHQLPPRPATRGGSIGSAPRTATASLENATAGRIIADGSQEGESDDEDGGGSDDEADGLSADAVSTDSPGPRPRRRQPRHKPCARCTAIEFPRLLDWKPGQPRPWIPLAHVVHPHPALPPSPPASTDGTFAWTPTPTPNSPPACPYCAFFQAMLGAGANGLAIGGKFTPYLRIRQAFERLDGVGERHELARSVLGEVMARHRALPWGFIVKATGDPDDVETYRAGVGAPARIRGRVVTPMLDPAVPRCWIDYCRDMHGATCGKVEAPISGLRLVDCQERRVVCAAGLVDSDPSLEYVTLSYVWGQADDKASAPFRAPAGGLDGSNDADLLLPARLPAVFADAVTLTLSLGLRYLWIDRYCFMPLDAGERWRQVGLLGAIFSRSALTLIVAAGEGVGDGIRGVSAARTAQLSLQTETGLFTTTLARADVEVAASRWATRAWTLQEGLLSRRRLVLGASQAYFQCRALHCHESVALPLRLAPDVWRAGRVFPAAQEVARPGRLREHIQAFMARELARPADRLDAFRGVLRAYARLEGLPVGDLLGLPLFHPDAFVNVASVVSQTDRLAVGLGWIPDGRWRRPATTAASGEAGEEDGGPFCRIMDGASFPSWTWLAWKLRPGPDHHHGAGARALFHFNLVGEASPVIDGVCAPPHMEMSIGFGDGSVLSWEIDGDAVAHKAEPIAFIRLETYCADFCLRRGGPGPWPSWVLDGAVPLSKDNKDAIEAWIQAAPPPPPPPPPPPSSSPASTPPSPPEHRLTVVLVSGRGWRAASDSAAATALICHRRGWDPAAPLVRLGAVSIGHDGFVAGDDDRHALLRGAAQVAAHAESDLRLRLRELDLY
ncbi:heterokaryon incompatibility protein [Hirsutella rhossiliensis]|uniref:Heterokaryon incompatibility protein (HET) domain-containing protein n=1 Tax=Hirsutella rhossiliensis TaxID=111463 RepID=A0A9P8N1D3_9HYPO|nr:heterokaryon incompatibility protein (HET) domain-containing protein [Hirsutella rhossiliensis]KAH0965132.1 heterokaryon incompatibility protein (HET) domain-containing protein [Hirsutella rhossiliensis]